MNSPLQGSGSGPLEAVLQEYAPFDFLVDDMERQMANAGLDVAGAEARLQTNNYPGFAQLIRVAERRGTDLTVGTDGYRWAAGLMIASLTTVAEEAVTQAASYSGEPGTQRVRASLLDAAARHFSLAQAIEDSLR